MGYPTLLEVKEYLGIDPAHTDDDAYLSMALAAVIESVEEYCQRKFPKVTYSDVIFDMHGAVRLFTKQWPIESITNMTLVNGGISIALDVSKQRVFKGMGELLSPVPLSGDLTIEYVAGYEPIPQMILFTIMESVKTVFAGKDTDATSAPIKSERIDGALTVSYDTSGSSSGDSGGGGGGDVPRVLDPFTSMLDTYRSERVWGAH